MNRYHPMRRCTVVMFLVLALAMPLALAQSGGRQEQPPYPEQIDPFTGDYEGRWCEEEDVDPEVAAQVVPLGRDRYFVRIVAKLDMRCPPHLETEAQAKDGVIEIDEKGIEAVIKDGTITGGRGRMKTFEMQKVTRLSPTLGLEPPENAVVLFDGSDLDAWNSAKGWEILDEGILQVSDDADTLKSKQQFKDCTFHIEFRLPYLPRLRGQQRGNSGVFLQGTYECQVLDSYGLDGFNNECGALYKVAAPKVNACAPPMQWQTYDIEYTAPRFDENGEVAVYPAMTVRHNGVLIHNDQELPWITGWKEKDRLKPPPSEPGSVELQAHNNFMQYRNIWIVPKDE